MPPHTEEDPLIESRLIRVATGLLKRKNIDVSESKLRRGLELATMAAATAPIIQEYTRRLKHHNEWLVSVGSDDKIYDPLHGVILDQIPEHKQRSLEVFTYLPSQRDPEPGAVTPRQPTPEVRYQYASGRVQKLYLDGHVIYVSLSVQRTSPSRTEKEPFFDSSYKTPEVIEFRGKSLEARKALDRLFRQIAEETYAYERKPYLYMMNKWGSWDVRNDIPTREMSTVVLAEGQLEGLVEDVDRFLAREKHYVKIGAPWHRGYLFYGPPGTGKTSTAKALAHHFGFDVFYAPLSDMSSDADLMNLVSGVSARSVLLLEDIDVLAAAQDREKSAGFVKTGKDSGVTLSGLLNALDGMATPHGLITIMTTNRREVLDDALDRKGRIDLDVHIDYLTSEQADRLFAMVYERPPRAPLDVPNGVAAADVIEVFKQTLDDDVEAERAVRELFEARRAALRAELTDMAGETRVEAPAEAPSDGLSDASRGHGVIWTIPHASWRTESP